MTLCNGSSTSTSTPVRCEMEESGLCINCNHYKSYECLNINYHSSIYGDYGKTKLYYIENDLNYRFSGNYSYIVKIYKELDMLGICFECIESINHPSLFEKLKFWLYGFYYLIY